MPLWRIIFLIVGLAVVAFAVVLYLKTEETRTYVASRRRRKLVDLDRGDRPGRRRRGVRIRR